MTLDYKYYKTTVSRGPISNIEHRLRSLLELTIHLTARTDDNHASPDEAITAPIQTPVRFIAPYQIKRHNPPIVYYPRLILWVSALRLYFPGGRFAR